MFFPLFQTYDLGRFNLPEKFVETERYLCCLPGILIYWTLGPDYSLVDPLYVHYLYVPHLSLLPLFLYKLRYHGLLKGFNYCLCLVSRFLESFVVSIYGFLDMVSYNIILMSFGFFFSFRTFFSPVFSFLG